MKPPRFDYADPRTLGEAVALMQQHEGEAKLLSGGQSLVPLLNMRLARPAILVDLAKVAGLDHVREDGATLAIGAMTRQRSVELSPVVKARHPMLHAATLHIAHPQNRNQGTVGGSLAHADPAAELPACLVALDGEVDIVGPQGKRSVKAGEFFKGLFETALGPQDVLSAVRFPAATADARVGFAELARRHGDYAIVGLAAVAKATGERLSDVRLVYFGVGATPIRARKAEAALAGGSIDDAVNALDLDPSDDIQATGAVKKHLAGVLLRRVAAQLMEPRA